MKILIKCKNRILLIFFGFLFVAQILAQGPLVSYYYQPATELDFAECHVYMEGGSKLRIPFMPVISRNFQRAPLGTQNYRRDIDIQGQLVFIGSGVVLNEKRNDYQGRREDYSIGEIDVTGKIVLFSIECTDSLIEKYDDKVSLEQRITEAETRGAKAAVLFTRKDDYPFLFVQYQEEEHIPSLPVITITRNSFEQIMASAGRNDESILEDWEKQGKIPKSEVLISKLVLNIEGRFDQVQNDHFLFCFRKKYIPRKQMNELVKINERSVKFIFDFFESVEKPEWDKRMNVYFRDYDSKLFYTHHWGRGLACQEGVFMVHQGEIPEFGLAVHENTHLYTYINWTDETCSFMGEGIAKHLEALAENKNQDHLAVMEFLKNQELFPLEELLIHQIGMSGLKTTVGYPATGSFVGFLIEQYGLKKFRQAFILEGRSWKEKNQKDTWQEVYDKSIFSLETEWLQWLVDHFQGTKEILDAHLNRISELRKSKKEKEALKPSPNEFPQYEGIFIWKEMGKEFSIEIQEGSLLMKIPGFDNMNARLIPVEKHGFRLTGGPVHGQTMIFHMDEEGRVINATMGDFKFVRK